MKQRSREINIFNMSLLDVLCGALGTFCFLMLVLFPFYTQDKGRSKAPEVPPGVDPRTYEDAMKRIKQLEETLKKFQDYAQQLEAQVSQVTAQNRQLQAEAKDLREKNAQLESRNPIVALARFNFKNDDEVEIYIEDNCSSSSGKRSPRVDAEHEQGPFWTGDKAARSGGLAFFIVRDAPKGEFKVFLKFIKHNAADPPMSGYVAIQSSGKLEVTPTIYNTREKIAVPVGVVSVGDDYKQTIQIAVPKEWTTPPS
jgi:hypothetical protein